MSDPISDGAVPDCGGISATGTDTYDIHLADGATVHLRPADHDDETFQRLFFSLSNTTRYLYFCAGVPATALWAERFATLSHAEGARAYVLVAEVADEVVGFARFSGGPQPDQQDNPQTQPVDVGIILTDAWQGRGLGGQLLCHLAAEARQRAVHTFSAIVMWENRRMLRLAQRLFPAMHVAYESGSCEITVDLYA